MHIIRNSLIPVAVPASSAGRALAIGNFDGFHRGHQEVVRMMQRRASESGLKAAVVFFEPQPAEFLAPGSVTRLFSLRDKLRAFFAAGVAEAVVIRFDRAFASLTPEAFAVKVLRDSLQARYVMVGSRFNFGCGGRAGYAELKSLGQKYGFDTGQLQTVTLDGERISSTSVRRLLAAGDLDGAARLLGRPYAVSGRVVHGHGEGRSLGFPTANLRIMQDGPLSGVFAARVMLRGRELPAVVNVGVRPSFGSGGARVLEAHLLNYTGSLYGEHVTVTFVHRLRDEVRFAGRQELMRQIAADRDAAAACLE